MRDNFTVLIQPAEEGGFWATCPEVPGANGQGETEDEAKQNLHQGIQAIFEDRLLHETESEAAWFAEAIRLGITTRDAVVSWADSRIMQLETPPYWLIELSTLQSRDLHDHASVIDPQLAAKLPVESLVSLVIDAQARKVVTFDQALALLFRIFLPMSAPPEGFPGPIADLLAELDCMEFHVPLSMDFISRCNLAFADHLKRHSRPPSAIFHPPSTI